MYAKLINGALRRAPKKITHEGKTIFNPSGDVLMTLGYYPVTHTDTPTDAPEGYYYTSGYRLEEEEIVQTWTLEEVPKEPVNEELSAEEALKIIMGD